MSQCRTCGASIRWVTMTSGRAMPVDPAPDLDGSVVARQVGTVWRDGRIERPDDPDRLVPEDCRVFMPHWRTCTDHARRPRRGATTPAPAPAPATMTEPLF